MRLFLAIELPGPVRREIALVRSALESSCPGWRWVRPEGVHLTLRFLGEVTAEDDARFRETWRRVASACSPVRLRLGGLGVFPNASRPRVLWLGLHEEPPGDGKLAAVASALEEAARGVGFPAEARPFRPHLTLARAERSGRPVVPPLDPAGSGHGIEPEEVVLFRSELQPGGAKYTRLAAFPFGSER